MKNFVRRHRMTTAIGLIYVGLAIFYRALAVEALAHTVYYLKEMAWIMPVVFMMIVAIEVLIPKAFIVAQLGEASGIKGTVFAFLLGSISAGPIYAAFPIGTALLKKGATVGNVAIILCAWAVIKVPMLANEAKFLGASYMWARWGLTVVAIAVIGIVMNRNIERSSILKSEKGQRDE